MSAAMTTTVCPGGIPWCTDHYADGLAVLHQGEVELEFPGRGADSVDAASVLTELFVDDDSSWPGVRLCLFRDGRPGAVIPEAVQDEDVDVVLTPDQAVQIGRALIEAATRARAWVGSGTGS